METENMKSMVVLRNLPSNIVEEAIVILKPNVKLKSLDLAENNKKVKNQKCQNNKKYIINEAEMIVNDYLSQMEKEKKSISKINKKIESKYKRVRAIAMVLGILFLASCLIR